MNWSRAFKETLFGALLFVSTNAWALDPSKSIAQYSLDAWLSRDGLPQNSVWAMLQTRDGYLWLGTEEGLVRFDGVRFTVYSTRNTPAFRQNTVEALAEGIDGSLWIGTQDGLLRKQGDRFTAYRVSEGLPNEFVLALHADPDGTLWIGTATAGLVCWKDERFVPAPPGVQRLHNRVSAFARSRDGSLWVGTDEGLTRVRAGGVVSYTKSDGLPSNRVNQILEGRDGALWVATGGGLARFLDGRITAVTTGKESPGVNALREDQEGTLWMGTSRGLRRVLGGTVEPFQAARGLSSDVVVLCLLQDRERNLWVGTDGGGLLRLRDAPVISYTKQNGLSNDFVRGVLEDAQGTVWFGTRGGGLNRFRDGRFSALTTREGLPHDAVSALTQTRDGALWVGTSGGGLARLQDGHVTRVYTEQDGLSSNNIRVLLEDRTGALWIGTSGEGLDRLVEGRITVFSGRDGLAGDTVAALCEDRDGVLWIGATTGLSSRRDGTFVKYGQKDGLSIDSIRALKADADGTLWIGTSGGGLARMRGGRFASVTARQGLFDDVVFTILDDDRGNLWMSCNRGIFHVARRELEAFFSGKSAAVTSVAYGEADGMASPECNGGFQPAGWRSRDGRLWFPTIRGLDVVNPQAIGVNSEPPPVVLEKVLVDGRDVGALAGQSFPPGSRLIELDYTGLSFLGSERTRFQYRLEGFDSGWVDAGTRRTAFYTNLPPGHYVFHVIAANSDGVWNRTGATLPFAMEPRFTQTRLFAVAVGLAILGIAVGIYVLRVRGLKARARELEAGIQEAFSNVRVLRGLFPICASCKKIRDDKGYWKQIESYIRDHSEAEFSHGICPECVQKLYPEYAQEPGVTPPEPS